MKNLFKILIIITSTLFGNVEQKIIEKFDDGTPKVVETYENGIIVSKEFYSGPNRYKSSVYLDKTYLYKNGIINKITTYLIIYNGKESEKFFNDDGVLEKRITFFNDGKTPMSIDEYKNGILIKGEYWESGPYLGSTTNYDQFGVRHGESTYYNSKGNIIKQEIYQRGFKKSGLCKDGYVELWTDCYNNDIIQIVEHYEGISGEIPSEIGTLVNLNKLSLWGNKLTGEIPISIGGLTNLKTLNLSNNKLTGKIPKEVCDLIKNNNLDINQILNGNSLINTCED